MDEQMNFFERLNNWIRNSVTLKLITIAFLVLILLIPASMITSIISERETRSLETIRDVSSDWAGPQLVNGPVLSVPLFFEYTVDGKVTQKTDWYHILPEQLNIRGQIDPQKLNRGIYEVVVFRSELSINGEFLLDKLPDGNDLKKIRWEEAFLTIGISDLRGIEEEISVNWKDQTLRVQPGSRIPSIIPSGITVELPDLQPVNDHSFTYSFLLKLQGSGNISFVPAGNTTRVQMKSSWQHPGFNGSFLPDEREINDQGFTGEWKVLQLNRNFPQAWTGSLNSPDMNQSAFGVDLVVPLDDYQKSMRSAKYAVMTITLTFLIFFLVEILKNRKIHPFQYTLVGLALCLFYILLVSITEHAEFNLAYLISAITVIIMITLYSLSVFKSLKSSAVLFVSMTIIYSFLYVTLQLADYALLIGSLGLTLILSLTMYYTRNINWYQLNNGIKE